MNTMISTEGMTIRAAVAGVLTAFPDELVIAVAGLALLGTIGSGLADALASDRYREAGPLTFLVALSGVSLGGVDSAVWGVWAGAVASESRLGHRGAALPPREGARRPRARRYLRRLPPDHGLQRSPRNTQDGSQPIGAPRS